MHLYLSLHQPLDNFTLPSVVGKHDSPANTCRRHLLPLPLRFLSLSRLSKTKTKTQNQWTHQNPSLPCHGEPLVRPHSRLVEANPTRNRRPYRQRIEPGQRHRLYSPQIFVSDADAFVDSDLGHTRSRSRYSDRTTRSPIHPR